jgi:putative flippase GtrA
MKKGDIIVSLILGGIIGLFLAFILQGFGFVLFSPWILVPALPILSVIGVAIGELIGKKIPVILQLIKFGMVGFANTAVDFGILNLLMATTGITSGKNIFLLNSISFVVAVTHSYFWNKFWTFKVKKTEATKEFLQFLIVSIIGLLINGGIVYMITTWTKPMFGLTDISLANVGKIAATVI